MLKRNKKRFFSAGTCLALIITVGFIPFLSSCKRRKKLTIASKDFTEQKILAEMIGQIFKDQNIPYKIKL